MDLEHLTKGQIVLLTLLVSFVTSIATGIVTVTLVDQAPTDVTRTINRVVEKTVERVVPGETKIVERVKEISNPTQSDLAIGAIDKNKDVLVYLANAEGSVLSRGFFIGNDGEAVVYSPVGTTEGSKFSLYWLADKSASSTPVSVVVESVDAKSGAMLVVPIATSSAPKSRFVEVKQAIVPVIGQQIISIGYRKNSGTVVEFGNVTAILDQDSKEGERKFIVSADVDSTFVGGPVVDLEGRVLGWQMGQNESTYGSVVLPLALLDKAFGPYLAKGPATESQTANVSGALP